MPCPSDLVGLAVVHKAPMPGIAWTDVDVFRSSHWGLDALTANTVASPTACRLAANGGLGQSTPVNGIDEDCMIASTN